MPSAFSLIELLVVVAIILVLARLLLPLLESARTRGYHAACASQLHQLGVAFFGYRADNGNLPGAGWPGGAEADTSYQYVRLPGGGVTLSNGALDTACMPGGYSNAGKISALGSYMNASAKPCGETIFHCPTDDTPENVSYSMNLFIRYSKQSDLPNPAGTYLLIEEDPRNGNDLGQCGPGDRVTRGWHNGGAMSLFCDGHTAWGPLGPANDPFVPGTLNYDFAYDYGCYGQGNPVAWRDATILNR